MCFKETRSLKTWLQSHLIDTDEFSRITVKIAIPLFMKNSRNNNIIIQRKEHNSQRSLSKHLKKVHALKKLVGAFES